MGAHRQSKAIFIIIAEIAHTSWMQTNRLSLRSFLYQSTVYNNVK